jgi:hypothetical protein
MPSQIYQNLPGNMDTEFSGPTVWSGSDKTADQLPYAIDISAYIPEIEAALEKFKELGHNGPAVNADAFPLPTLGPRLKAIARDLHEGPGFALLRGLDTEKYSDEDNMIIFLGIGSHIGSQRGKYRPMLCMIRHAESEANNSYRFSEQEPLHDLAHHQRQGVAGCKNAEDISPSFHIRC